MVEQIKSSLTIEALPNESATLDKTTRCHKVEDEGAPHPHGKPGVCHESTVGQRLRPVSLLCVDAHTGSTSTIKIEMLKGSKLLEISRNPSYCT